MTEENKIPMIQLRKDFFANKPWGRQAVTIQLFMLLLSCADSEGKVSIDIHGMQKATGICCTSKIKFCLRQLEYSGNLAIEKINGKRIYKINTDDN